MTTKAKSNCWTCKERKVGCDKAFPECVNCTKSKRKCKGYELKLAWPDKYDGRRKQKKYQAAPEGSAKQYIAQNGSFTFLDTTFDDVEGKRRRVQEMVEWVGDGAGFAETSVPRVLDTYRLAGGEGALLLYYDSVVARMITTIDDDTNGFRRELIPMALSSPNASARSLLQATLALSSFHLGRPEEALKHKVKAINALSESFKVADTSRVAQFAACMMLCVYSVFDATDTTWHLHLQGAKNIEYAFSQYEREQPCLEFLQPWFDYHDTFSRYSHRVDPRCLGRHIILPESTAANRKIIGLLGCSTELLRLISCINQLRILQSSFTNEPPTYSSSLLEPFLRIREQLIDLKQEIHIQVGVTTGTISHNRITLTAELYRIAALLYLYEIAPPSTIHESEVKGLVREGFVILGQNGICTSPWPLFIVACSAFDDRDRIKAMRVIEEGARERRVGNYQIVKSLVQAVWKRRDLDADEKDGKSIDWRELLEPSSSMPSFI